MGAAPAVGLPVSLKAIAPPRQGDVLCGLTLAVAGVGPAGPDHLPPGFSAPEARPDEAWVGAVPAETGRYVLLSQDCDIARDTDLEPTVAVAPLALIDQARWEDLAHNGHSSRRYPFPHEPFGGLPAGKGLAVDVAWSTSVMKGALTSPGVSAIRALTGPQRQRFRDWLAARAGRAPFPDEVVRYALDPCYAVRKRLSAAFTRAAEPANAKLEARLVASVDRWFAHVEGRSVTILGALARAGLHVGGFIDPGSGEPRLEAIERATQRLQLQVTAAMNGVDARSGFTLRIICADLANVRADQFAEFSLLLR